MKIVNSLSIQNLKYLAGAYFIGIGLLNLGITTATRNELHWFDAILLIVLALPLLINRRLFFLGYGFLASLLTLPVLIIFVSLNNPFVIDTSLGIYLLGCLAFSLAFLASLTFIYIGTYSAEKNRFTLI